MPAWERCLCLWSGEHTIVSALDCPVTFLINEMLFSFAYMEGKAFRHGDIVSCDF